MIQEFYTLGSYQELACNVLLDPQRIFYSVKTCFTLHGSINSQNNRYWCTENTVHEEPLPIFKSLGLLCNLCVEDNWIHFLYETINSECHVTLTVNLLQSNGWWQKIIQSLKAWQCNSTHYEQFWGCIRGSLRQTSHKLRTVTYVITKFKSSWLLYVGPTGRKKACEQSTLFGRASRKY
jgi:hypothetical protein